MEKNNNFKFPLLRVLLGGLNIRLTSQNKRYINNKVREYLLNNNSGETTSFSDMKSKYTYSGLSKFGLFNSLSMTLSLELQTWL